MPTVVFRRFQIDGPVNVAVVGVVPATNVSFSVIAGSALNVVKSKVCGAVTSPETVKPVEFCASACPANIVANRHVPMALEHVLKKCVRFFDEDMLQCFESGASSFAERDSAFGERALEHAPKKCMRFFDEDMLQCFESGASSFAERDSAFGERALAVRIVEAWRRCLEAAREALELMVYPFGKNII